MSFDKLLSLRTFFFFWVISIPLFADAQETTLYQSVEQALNYSPQLQALIHNQEAVAYDLKQTRGRYLPSVDLLLGYGAEQHSDSVTRFPGADPSDTDWDSRGDATLRLTQKVYDGGETSQSISIRKALLASADQDVQEGIQAIILNAVNAHLEVYRQRELVALAEKDLEVHKDIYQALSEIEQAGAGNIADVTQTQTRMARAQSILIVSQADLNVAIANYERVVGVKPKKLAYAEISNAMPSSLEEALTWMEQKNPGLLAISARIMEADARVRLARSSYKPKINIELSSRYYDQLEGDPSWQHTNDAMAFLRWNLFNGGQDKEAVNAALSRKYESRSNRDEKLIELRDATASAWVTYLSLQRQKKAFQEAVASSEKTFDAYLKQFSVSRRSLLDVLDAEKEYFQSARQLVSVSVDKIMTAYRILRLSGVLQISNISDVRAMSTDFKRLAQAIVSPAAVQASFLKFQSLTSFPAENSDWAPGITVNDPGSASPSKTKVSARQDALCSIEIGPSISKQLLEQAKKILRNNGVDVQQKPGIGIVKITRLLEGVYPPDKARLRLEELKPFSEIFVLPERGNVAVYAGSFQNPKNAVRYAQLLAEQNIHVTPVSAEIEIQGVMLVVQQVYRKTAETISKQVSKLGLNVKVTGMDPKSPYTD